jgi:glycosyltransferase involved in cell wall biosynthesis
MKNKVPLVSVTVAAYNNTVGLGHSSEYNNITMLNNLIRSVYTQTYKNVEIVISDHSKDESVKALCDDWKGRVIIKYVKNEANRGSKQANTNNALIHASGKYIKTMAGQDDFLYNDDALEIMVNHLETTKHRWIFTGCLHCKENNTKDLFWRHTPRWPSDNGEYTFSSMLSGVNYIGGESVMMYEKNDVLIDNNLIWLMDVEFYYRLYKELGDPMLIDDICAVSRQREDSITSTAIYPDIVVEEKEYVYKKHAGTLKSISSYPHIYSRLTKCGLIDVALWRR